MPDPDGLGPAQATGIVEQALAITVFFILGVESGMGLLGFSAGVKFVVTGLVLLMAVLIDAISRRGKQRSGIA